MALATELRAKGFSLSLDGGKLLVAPSEQLTDELRDLIRAHKLELVDELSRLEARRERVERHLLDDPTIRTDADVEGVPLDKTPGDPISVVIAVRTPQGIVSGELLIPREKWDPHLFQKYLLECSAS